MTARFVGKYRSVSGERGPLIRVSFYARFLCFEVTISQKSAGWPGSCRFSCSVSFGVCLQSGRQGLEGDNLRDNGACVTKIREIVVMWLAGVAGLAYVATARRSGGRVR